MATTTAAELPAESFECRRGIQLAIQLIEACEAGDGEDRERRQLPASILYGVPQQNVVLPYIEQATAGGPEVLEGFARILSDFIATVSDGALPDSTYYRDRRAHLERIAEDKARDLALEVANG
jgi:hypothetical protein